MRVILIQIDPSHAPPLWDLYKYTDIFMAYLGTVPSA